MQYSTLFRCTKKSTKLTLLQLFHESVTLAACIFRQVVDTFAVRIRSVAERKLAILYLRSTDRNRTDSLTFDALWVSCCALDFTRGLLQCVTIIMLVIPVEATTDRHV